jgi:hypothetical protein
MGGFGSGRTRERNRGTVDAAFRLDLRALRRKGFLVAGWEMAGVLSWRSSVTGEKTGSVGFTTNLIDPEAGFVEIRFRLDGEPRVERIQLASRAMRFGGRRYYFLCPRTGRRCEVLPMVAGEFASRQAHRLTYQSQSSTQIDRMRDRVHKLEKRIWPERGNPRPRGRNRMRLIETWERENGAFEYLCAATFERRWGSLDLPFKSPFE